MMKRLWPAIAALIAAASLVVELFFMHHEPGHSHWWNEIPGFFIFFGFFGCVIIILFAKTLGKKVLDRPEDYYDAD